MFSSHLVTRRKIVFFQHPFTKRFTRLASLYQSPVCYCSAVLLSVFSHTCFCVYLIYLCEAINSMLIDPNKAIFPNTLSIITSLRHLTECWGEMTWPKRIYLPWSFSFDMNVIQLQLESCVSCKLVDLDSSANTRLCEPNKEINKDQAVSAKMSADRGTTDHNAQIEKGQ